MKRVLLLLVLVCGIPALAQNYQITLGGLHLSSGANAPVSCSPDGSFFFKTGTGWMQCVSGVYTSMGSSSGVTSIATTAPISGGTITTTGTISCNACVVNNGTNTGTTAMTLDLSAATTANAFKVPVGAGVTAGADGVIAYDTTNKNLHIRANAADGFAMATGSVMTSGAIPKSLSASTSMFGASSITDNGTLISSAEVWKFGTAGGNPHQDLTMGSTTAAMTQQTSATLTNVTGMTWTINANKNYRLTCEVPITFTASATVQFALNGPGTPTSYSLVADGPIGASAAVGQFATYGAAAWGTKTTVSGAPGAATETVHIYGFIQNGATASGTALTLQTAANGTNGITVGANASCDLKQVN